MTKPLATALAFLALASPAALAQSNPFGPLSPPQPAPPPIEEPEPPAAPKVDDQQLSLVESLVLAGLAAVLIGGVFVLITRETGRFGRAARRGRRRGGSGPAIDARKRGAGAFRATGGAVPSNREGAPPPPPRKRQPKSKAKAKRK